MFESIYQQQYGAVEGEHRLQKVAELKKSMYLQQNKFSQAQSQSDRAPRFCFYVQSVSCLKAGLYVTGKLNYQDFFSFFNETFHAAIES